MVDTILVLDFGGQYCHLIARRIRELKVYSEIVSPDITPEKIKKHNFDVKGIIISGGPRSVYEKESPKFDKSILDLDIGILGLCYGHQLIAHYMGGKVEAGGKKEFGITTAYIDKVKGILEGLDDKEQVWMSHGDTVLGMPPDFEIISHTDNCPIAAYMHKSKNISGLQWHPEVVHTKNGNRMLENFVKMCGCKQDWVMGDFVKKSVSEIAEKVGGGKAIIALSGGVDSSVAAVLTSQAIGKNLVAVFVDTGLMRKNETEMVYGIFSKFDLNLRVIDAKDRFFNALKDVEDPEMKRKIIGETFIRIFEDVAQEVGAEFLVQGTIYPDRIESGTEHACTIKTHHNVGGVPDKLGLKIVEPLRDLYKDEVRKVGRTLDLPDEIVERHPFPGPGLAIRILGAVTPESARIVRDADFIVKEEIKKSGMDKDVWQCFAVLLPVRTVGVQGDLRTYSNAIALRIVQSIDGMTANFANVPYDVLEKISTRITNEIPEVNRVVYDITHKPPGTVEWE